MIRKLYMKVTTDEFELPIYCADSVRELAKMCGVKANIFLIQSETNQTSIKNENILWSNTMMMVKTNYILEGDVNVPLLSAQ